MPEPIARRKIATVTIPGGGCDWNKVVSDHQEIVDTLKRAGGKGMGLTVPEIASRTGISEDLVTNHLKLMDTDQSGAFMDADNHTFCLSPGLIKAVNQLGSLE